MFFLSFECLFLMVGNGHADKASSGIAFSRLWPRRPLAAICFIGRLSEVQLRLRRIVRSNIGIVLGVLKQIGAYRAAVVGNSGKRSTSVRFYTCR